jgi:hypothetical protein
MILRTTDKELGENRRQFYASHVLPQRERELKEHDGALS